ncbi:hypothetical protein [Ferrimonas sediminicola]|uniref:hypothetical protein n=1 Tax=Ferrimonas sediminicola TaxID=2569538 RepID=UPI00145E930B|nr:hypothetical protein [Ferrimonas sediminicola]
MARLFTDDDVQLVYQTLMQKVREGDPAALSLISRYVAAPPKSAYSPTPFDYNQDDPLSGAQSIMMAIAKGELPADVGRSLIEGLASVQRIREVVELEQRLTQLEEEVEGKQ